MWKICATVGLIFVILTFAWAEVLTYEDFFKKLATTTSPETNMKLGNIIKVGCKPGFRFIYGKCRQVF